MVDWSFRIGDIISLFGALGGGALIFFGLRERVELISQRVGFLEKTVEKATTEIGKLGELLIKMGRYEERMLSYDEHIILLRKEVEALKHGEGFINSGRLANAGNSS